MPICGISKIKDFFIQREDISQEIYCQYRRDKYD